VTNVDDGERAPASAQREGSVAALLRDAQELLQDENFEGALELYQAAAALDPARVELEGYVDLLRCRLVKICDRIGDGRRVPKLLVCWTGPPASTCRRMRDSYCR
jgi:hypothetical protein